MADDGGIARLKRRLAAIPAAVKAETYATTLQQAHEIAATMRSIAPDDPSTDDPDLKSSIAVTPAGSATPPYSQPGGSMVVREGAVAITAGNSEVRYPHLVEYGHKKGFHGSVVPPHPFFWPAFRLHKDKATRAIKAAVRRAARSNWGKA